MYEPIPSKNFPENNIKYLLSDEELVEVKDFVFEPFYYNKGLSGAVDRCFLRQSVFEKLKIAQSFLPQGLRFKIYDGWRPFEVQMVLYRDYREKVKSENPHLSEEEVDFLTKLFVSPPVKNEFDGPVHATGGAVDLTVIDADGNELDMGCEFDFFGDMANTDYFEKNDINCKIRDNRRMLYHAMILAGFTNLPTEWWHYDFGNKFNGFYTGKKAIYGCVFSIEKEE